MNAEKKKTILLVDDEVITAMAEKMILEKFGYNVILANTGEDAVAAVRKTLGIDLILMDINLGDGIDGTEAAAIILKERDLPVVFLSSHTEPEVVAKTEKITSYGYVVKNSSNTVLDASIKMAFKLFEAKIKEQEKEDALRESEQRLNFHVNNSPLATIEWTTDFIVTRWSDEAEKIFGWNQSETIGKPMLELKMIYEEDVSLVRKTMEQLSNGSTKRVISTNRNYTKEGKVIVCEWYNSVLLNPQGKMISIMSQGINITERKQVELDLRKSEERLRDFIFSMADWVWEVDENGVYTYSSDKGSDYFGTSRGDIIGKKPFDFMSADEAKRVGTLFSEIVANKLPIMDLENWNFGRNGERICLLTNGVPILDEKGNLKGYRGVDKDITARKRAEDKIKNALSFQQALLDAVPSPIFYKDANFIYIGGNKAFEKYIGLPRAQFIGKTVYDIAPADLAERYDRADRELLSGSGIQTYDGSVVYADGTRHDVIFIKAVFTNAEGRVAGMIGVILDITERKQAENEIKRQLAEKEILLKEVHHRIKNNIASISGLITLQMQSVTNPEAVAVLQDAIGRVDSMRVLYDKLLLSEDFKDVSIKNYVQSLTDTIVALFPGSAKVTVDKRIDSFHLDPKRLFPLGLIINELLTNKMKYAFIGRDAGKIKISLTTVDKHVKLFVEDDGNGLPEGFDIDQSKGFGLMLVKMLSKQLGGSFSMEKDKGTRCTVEFDM